MSFHFAEQVTKAFVKLLRMKAHTDQLLFPEMLGKCFIVNTPSLFSYVWGMFSPLVDERTRSKVRHVMRSIDDVCVCDRTPGPVMMSLVRKAEEFR